MTTQPEALRLAEVFETYAVDHQPEGWPAIRQETLNSAAAELRRLHAENEALRVALEQPGVEPVAWIRPSGKAMLEAMGHCTVYASEGMSNHSMPLYAAPQPAQQTSTCGRCVVFCQGGEGCHCGAPPLSQREREALVTDQLNRRAPKPAPNPDTRATAIQACIDRLIQGGKPAEAGMLRHHFAKDLGEE